MSFTNDYSRAQQRHNGALRSSATARKYDSLARLSQIGVEPEARNFLIQALDPFHDNTINLCAVPDGDSRQSRIMRKTATHTFTVPANSTWSVTSLPLLSYMDHVRVVGVDDNVYTESGADLAIQLGMINVLDEGLRGESHITDYVRYAWAPDPLGRGNLSSDDTYGPAECHLRYRVIGAGYELHNVTATITRGGSIASVSQPHSSFIQESDFNLRPRTGGVPAPAQYWYSGESVTHNFPPPVEIAPDLVNYTVWDSSFGSYTVIPIDGFDAQSETYRSQMFVYGSQTNGQPMTVALMTPPAINSDAPPSASNINSLGRSCRPYLPSNTSVCCQYISTATEPQTFRLEMRVYLEEIPLGDADYSSTNANSEYSPRAMEMVRLYFQTNFPTCYVGENASGGWFASVVSNLLRAAPDILGHIPKIGAVAKAVSSKILPQLADRIDRRTTASVNNAVSAIRVKPSPSARPGASQPPRSVKKKKKIAIRAIRLKKR